MIRSVSFLLLVLLAAGMQSAATPVSDKLRAISAVSDVREVAVGPFESCYEFWFEQPVDHAHPDGATFKQRVLLGHKKQEAPVVVELPGGPIESSDEGELPGETELSSLLKGNQLIIEHRFFAGSIPENGEIPWEYLTIRQAAADQHAVIQALKAQLYPANKWITTGTGQGGQSAIFHRYFYPEDAHVTVPYVAPLNLDRTDPRIRKFLDRIGSTKISVAAVVFGAEVAWACKWSVHDFQMLCFEQLDRLLPLIAEIVQEQGYTFETVGGLKRAVQLIILENRFSFWRWGHPCGSIPDPEDDPELIADHLLQVSDPSFFDDKHLAERQPFFYTAFTETGLYDYNVKPFRKFLPDKENITFAFALPPGAERKPFNKTQMEEINRWLQTDAEKMLFIYGGLDPWTATAVDLKQNGKCQKYLQGGAHHGCRIATFEGPSKMGILETLKEWLQ
ncbi:MAG: peptidase [Culturomica sp.]|jgi:hypothetical protein|nr:peptidase [Culturomica sp.]